MVDGRTGAGNPESIRGIALGVLATTLGLQTMRALFPLVIFRTNFGLSVPTPAIIVFWLTAVFLSPFLGPFVAGLMGARRGLLIALSGLAALRFALQISQSVDLDLILASIALVLTLAVLPLGIVLSREKEVVGDANIAFCLLLGLALDSALNSVFLTWDSIWRRDVASLLTTLILCTGLAAILWFKRRTTSTAPGEVNFRSALPLALLGPFLAVQVLILHNVAFLASLTGLSTPAISGVVLLGDILALLTTRSVIGRISSAAARGAAGLTLVGVLFLLISLGGVVSALLVLVAQPLTFSFLVVALAARPATLASRQSIRTSASVGLASILFLGFVAAHHVAYELRLAVPGVALVHVISGALPATWYLLRISGKISFAAYRLSVAFLAVLLVVPLGLFVTEPNLSSQVPPTTRFRIMSYNIHQGINVSGWVNLEDIAAAIQGENPDVVVIQEAIRGQLATGGQDTGEWPSRRLKMSYRFSPATDPSYGELLLSRLPILSWELGHLPAGEGGQPRSYVWVELDLGPGKILTVVGTHLDHSSQQRRISQVEQLLTAWSGRPWTIIAGDMNASPGTTEIERFEAAGLVSAQDTTGNGHLLTFDSVNPTRRIDWIFGTPDIHFSDFAIPRTTASDHLPVIVTATLP